jgi:polar amino acid transport system substrate-binding protein
MTRSATVAFLAFILPTIGDGAFAQAADLPAPLKLCFADHDSYPWHSADGRGVSRILLDDVASRLGIGIEYLALPWARCLDDMRLGNVDGAFEASFLPERRVLGAYPESSRGGGPDVQRRMLVASYHLYRSRGSALSWDGHEFSNVSGAVLVLRGASVFAELQSSGVEVFELTGTAQDALRLVSKGMNAAAALFGEAADIALQQDPGLAQQIEKLPVPLVVKPYYVMLSHQRVDHDATFAETFWNTVAVVRDSETFRKASARYLESAEGPASQPPTR